MESLANQLRMEMLKYNKYGTKENIEKAEKAFETVKRYSFESAREGYDYVTFDESILPRKSAEYFKRLCEDEELKFEVYIDRTPDGKAEYTVSWG